MRAAAPALVEDALPVVIRRVAVPAVASNLLMTVFASTDAYWVGTRIGPLALAAVTTSLFWIWLAVSVVEMVSVGLTAVAARRHGERRPEAAAEAAGDAMLYALSLGIVVALGGTYLLDSLFSVMHTSNEVAAVAHRYLGTYLLGSPLVFGYFVVDATFRASGDTRTPLVILALSVAATLVLDPMLILGLAGLPKLGIVGAALATICTRAVAFVIGTTVLVRRKMIRVGRPAWSRVSAITRIGAPTALTGVLFSAIYVAVARSATQFGTPALAALGLGFRIESWLYMLGVGFGAAAAAIVGQNMGAGHVDRAARVGWVMLGYAMVPAFIVFVLELVMPMRLAGIFTNDGAVIAETARYLRIAALSQLFVCSEVVLEGALGGAGDTVPPMLASTTLSAARIPLAAWAAARWGIVGIWWTISLTATARGMAMMALWRAGGWRRKTV